MHNFYILNLYEYINNLTLQNSITIYVILLILQSSYNHTLRLQSMAKPPTHLRPLQIVNEILN